MLGWDCPVNYHWVLCSQFKGDWVLIDSKGNMCGFSREKPNWGMKP